MRKISVVFLIICNCCFAQKKAGVVGIYGKCEHFNNCFQLDIKEDNAFKYYINEYTLGKGIIEGIWRANGDTLLLDFKLPEKEKPVFNEYLVDTISDKMLVLKRNYEKPVYIDSAKVILNDTLVCYSQKNGIIHINLESINKIVIIDSIDTDCVDTIKYVPENTNFNLLQASIPITCILPAFYYRPNKWLIKRNKLYPLNWNYEINKQGYIEKSSKLTIPGF